METKLEPCPFCGQTETLFIGTQVEIAGGELDKNDDYYAVCCDFTKNGCGACSGYEQSTEAAVKAWNRRISNG